VLPILGPFSATYLVARWFPSAHNKAGPAHEPGETRHWHEEITGELRSARDHQPSMTVHPYLSRTADGGLFGGREPRYPSTALEVF